MTTLKIQRNRSGAGQLRHMRIYVDQNCVARLRPGGEWEAPVEPGHHEVAARMDWCASSPLVVDLPKDGETTVKVSFPLSSILKIFLRPKRAIECRVDQATLQVQDRMR